MALSNWDTLAIDLNGNPTNGVFVNPISGVQVEIYKNWVYVHDPKNWHEGGNYVEPTVMQIQHGSLSYHNTMIEAIRGPQNGVYVVTWCIEWDKKDEKGKATYSGMIGCGVYGFEGEEWVGVTKESLDFLKNWVTKEEQAFDDEEIQDMVAEMKIAIEKGAKVTKTLEEYVKGLRKITNREFDDRIASVDFSKALRFCQGDGYFEEKTGVECSATPVGEAETPIFLQLLGEPKKDKDGNT